VNVFFSFYQDKDISKILSDSDRSLTITIMPTFIYEHMVKW